MKIQLVTEPHSPLSFEVNPMKQWKCTVCGYINKGDTPPETCPVCGADRSLFILLEEAGDIAPAPAEGDASSGVNENSRWRCSVCGYIHTGSSPPEKCPVCGADRSQFVLLPEDPAESEQGEHSSAEENITDDESPKAGGRDPSSFIPERFRDISLKLTELHGHPIAVHIPNGVLPISVMFVFLSLLFGSEALATAAKVNIIMVALTMPIVIVTGMIDWINTFKGRMTEVFRIKMICAGVVTFLSIILAIWWLVDPDLYAQGLFNNFFFFLLHLVDLAAGAIAGWYGGKLVFRTK
ncbi:rubredoxin-like domain-containing protein [Desulfatitalea tepidiphila]|uniref:rubredoxin-like domain-containing protein n=1 Tax=Desulfatitalea tepidiphila TaxID=1185843 RepID=UPI00128EAC1B|nr:DUF2231 domain-containing protein [Desulfatitalea tepidiphila]